MQQFSFLSQVIPKGNKETNTINNLTDQENMLDKGEVHVKWPFP